MQVYRLEHRDKPGRGYTNKGPYRQDWDFDIDDAYPEARETKLGHPEPDDEPLAFYNIWEELDKQNWVFMFPTLDMALAWFRPEGWKFAYIEDVKKHLRLAVYHVSHDCIYTTEYQGVMDCWNCACYSEVPFHIWLPEGE